MSRWTCPRCDREFRRARQSHDCVPGCTVDESFATWPQWRPIYDALIAHLHDLGSVHEDAVRVGVFLKREDKLADIRPRARSLQVAIVLPRELHHDRVSRTYRIAEDRIAHFVKLTSVDQVDAQLKEWLTEAYVNAG